MSHVILATEYGVLSASESLHVLSLVLELVYEKRHAVSLSTLILLCNCKTLL